MREQIKELLVRELTEKEEEQFNRCHAMRLNEMLICPDQAELIETKEKVEVSHSFNTFSGVFVGITFLEGDSAGKYSTVPLDWVKVAANNR